MAHVFGAGFSPPHQDYEKVGGVRFTLNFPTGDDDPTYFDTEKQQPELLGTVCLNVRAFFFVPVSHVRFCFSFRERRNKIES